MMSFAFVRQAINDCMTVLCFWEHTLILLDGQWHSVILKPLKGIARSKLLKEAFEQTCSTWICLLQVADFCKSVGAVATASTRNLHLCQHFALLLEDGDIEFWHHFLCIDSQEKTSRTSANNG